MRIGYSFWGFLGKGVLDTPDGGRSHRRVLVDGLRQHGGDLIFLQRNRDSLDAGELASDEHAWSAGFPDISLLFLEWRWPIQGRNFQVSPDSDLYTPDWDRQQALLDHYCINARTPTIIWDKD